MVVAGVCDDLYLVSAADTLMCSRPHAQQPTPASSTGRSKDVYLESMVYDVVCGVVFICVIVFGARVRPT